MIFSKSQLAPGIVRGMWLALRAFRRSPLGSFSIAGAFAIGLSVIGLAFGVYEAAVLRPLPFDKPDALFLVRLYSQESDSTRWQWPGGPEFVALQERLSSGTVAAASGSAGTVGVRAEGRALSVLRADVSTGFFVLLGTVPRCGKLGSSAGMATDVVLSSRLSADLFGDAVNGCGRAVSLNGVVHQVVGVLPADFRWNYGQDFDVWTTALDSSLRTAAQMDIVVRLGDDRSPGSLAPELATFNVAQGANRTPKVLRPVALRAVLLDDNPQVVGTLALIVLLGSSIAVANIMALFLSRAQRQLTQVRVQLALGAGKTRLVAEALGEAIVYAAAGFAVALVVIVTAEALLAADVLASLPSARELQLNWRVLVFLSVAAFVIAVIASVPGVALVWSERRISGASLLLHGMDSERARSYRTHLVIVGLQLAIVVIVMTGAVLCSLSLAALARKELGFSPDNVLTFSLRPRGVTYRTLEGANAYHLAVLSRVRSLPAVDSAAVASGYPLGGSDNPVLLAKTTTEAAEGNGTKAIRRAAGDQYFETLRMQLIAGKVVSNPTSTGGLIPVVLNEHLARRLWPDASPVGQTLAIGERLGRSRIVVRVAEVAGVVRDSVTRGLADPDPEIYVPMSESPLLSSTLLVRVRTDSPDVRDQLAREILAVDSSQLLLYGDPKRLTALVDGVLQRPRLYVIVTAIVGMAVTALALYGLFALVSSVLSTRRRDLAILSSFGAMPRHLLAFSSRGILMAASTGLLLGVIGSWLLLPLVVTRLGLPVSYRPALQLMVVAALAIVVGMTIVIPVLKRTNTSPGEILRLS